MLTKYGIIWVSKAKGAALMSIKNSFEVFVEVLNCNGTSFVQDLTDLDAIIVM